MAREVDRRVHEHEYEYDSVGEPVSALGKSAGDKFSRDVLWNIASLGIAGVCGVAVNFLVGIVYGSHALGAFNQVFAVYLVFAQLAALGVHISVLTYSAAEDRLSEQQAIVTAGLLVTAAQALVMVAIFVLAAGPIGRLLDSDAVAAGIPWAAPGLVCFALNKVVLNVLNARRRMRAYAVFQAGRVVLICAGFAGCLAVDASSTTLPVILSIGEVTVFFVALFTIRDQLARPPKAQLARWGRIHWRFGLRGFLSGLFSELNTRIDVFILGVYTTDAIVGAYSMAALIAEGIYQVLIALRTNYAPIAVRHLARGEQAELLAMIRKGRNLTYAGAAVMAAVSIAVYALVVPLFTADPMLHDSWIYFAILLGGMAASAGYAPFNQLLLWGNRPGSHTVLIALIVGASALANVAFASTYGSTGSAIATAATYVWSVLALKLMVARVLALRI